MASFSAVAVGMPIASGRAIKFPGPAPSPAAALGERMQLTSSLGPFRKPQHIYAQLSRTQDQVGRGPTEQRICRPASSRSSATGSHGVLLAPERQAGVLALAGVCLCHPGQPLRLRADPVPVGHEGDDPLGVIPTDTRGVMAGTCVASSALMDSRSRSPRSGRC